MIYKDKQGTEVYLVEKDIYNCENQQYYVAIELFGSRGKKFLMLQKEFEIIYTRLNMEERKGLI